jgi:hypothetical protein
MRKNWPKGFNAEVDTSLTGVTFVDILFALAVAAILNPVEQRVTHPIANPLPASNVLSLVITLSLVLGSFIGYHNSSSKPRFKIRFVNSSFVKFTLDILMVIAYFVLAALAARKPIDLTAEVMLLCITFMLYVFWDLASLYESRRQKYEEEWKRAFEKELIRDPWLAFNPSRMIPTCVCFVIFVSMWIYLDTGTHPISFTFTVIFSFIMIFVIFGYRLWKDLLSHRAKNASLNIQS